MKNPVKEILDAIVEQNQKEIDFKYGIIMVILDQLEDCQNREFARQMATQNPNEGLA